MSFEIKKIITASVLLSSMAAIPSVNAAESFNDAIKKSTTSGQFRLGYISVDPGVAGVNTTRGNAFGGILKFETEKWKRMQFAIAPYFSERIKTYSGKNAQNTLNSDFLNSNGESYVYLGEAYINYAFKKGSLRGGHQKLDNPFINTDDIRMHPNTFSALWLNMSVSDNLQLDTGRVTQMAGFDAGSPDKFIGVSNDGVSALGLTYKMKAHHTFQGWYYDFNDQYSQYYFDAAYANGNFSAGLQYSKYNEVKASGTAGNVYGITANYAMGPITLGLAINQGSNAANKSASLGLGGGSYFASMEEMTIGGLTNAEATVVSAEYAVSEKFNIRLAVGHFEDSGKATADTDETDLVLSYALLEQMDAQFVYTLVDNKAAPTDKATNFSRQIARMSYNF